MWTQLGSPGNDIRCPNHDAVRSANGSTTVTFPREPERAPPGWYGDPSGVATWRWWDGYSWTHHVWPPGPLVREDYAEEQKAAPYGQLAFIAWVLAIGGGLWIAWTTNHNQNFRQSLHPPFIADLVFLVQIPVYVGLLIWQFRAAKTARSLGLPAKHSPALGAWSWIIPIVMYWFPYQAIRDCLPWEEPNRRVVQRMWFCFVAMSLADLAAVVLIDIGLSAGAILSGIALAFGIGFAFMGAKSVRVIADAHGRLISSSS